MIIFTAASRAIRLAVLSLILVFTWGGASAQQTREDYGEIVGRMLERYPQAHVQDIYKSFFQDRFGPGHLVSDTTAARQYLHRELLEMDSTAMPLYEAAGAGRNYYRVSLAVIKDGIIPEQDFFDIFLESASKVTFPAIEEWAEEWAGILKVIPADLENYAADRAMIDSVLARGEYAVHHSRQFEEVYRPHYRLIDKSTFQSRLLPLLPPSGR